VVHEEVAVDPEVFVGNVEVRSEEFDEEAGHRGIGVRELHRIAALRSLGPVEHASGQMGWVTHPGTSAPIDLVGEPSRSSSSRVRACDELAVDGRVPALESRILLVRELDVPRPEAHRRQRAPDETSDLLHRVPFLAQGYCTIALSRFHFREQ
jgi:hypothetical protein